MRIAISPSSLYALTQCDRGQRLIERELDVQPTITVRPGWPVRVIVAKDLVLKPYVEAQARRQK